MKEKILDAYEALADRYNAMIDHKPHNAYYDRPNTLALMGELEGKQVLDAACGPGKYAEILIEAGAQVTGFDLSPKMVQYAKDRLGGKADFFVHDLAMPLTMCTDESYNIVLVALAMHYVENWEPVVREFCRVLKPGGQVILSIEHPIFDYNYFKSNKYFEVEEVSATWKGFGVTVDVPCYRRSLQDCINPFTENGFFLDKLVEPLPVEEFKRRDPKHYEELQEFPAFMCMRMQKR